MSEASLTARILAWLRGNGFLAWKYHGSVFGVNGMPDIHAVRDGRFYCFEVKTAKGRLTKLQERKLAELAAAGAVCGVVRSLDDVQRLIEENSL